MPCCMQDILPELYCGHDAFLFSSRYEAWGMPVLEAMAAGLAVVATACLGVDTFARHGMNALLAPPQVPKSSLLQTPSPPPPPPPLPCSAFLPHGHLILSQTSSAFAVVQRSSQCIASLLLCDQLLAEWNGCVQSQGQTNSVHHSVHSCVMIASMSCP